MIHQILVHWKAEVAVTSVIVGIGLLANQATSPKVIMAIQVVAAWNEVITKQMVISMLTSTLLLVGAWWLNKKTSDKKDKRIADETAKAATLQTALGHAKEKEQRLAKEQDELNDRVTENERILNVVKEKLALMDQRATPLFAAAESRLIDILTHPHAEFKIPDELLAQVKIDHIVTPELEVLLKERETSDHPDVTAEEKLAAALLPTLSKIVLNEKEVLDALVQTTTQVVSVPVLEKEKEKEKES